MLGHPAETRFLVGGEQDRPLAWQPAALGRHALLAWVARSGRSGFHTAASQFECSSPTSWVWVLGAGGGEGVRRGRVQPGKTAPPPDPASSHHFGGAEDLAVSRMK